MVPVTVRNLIRQYYECPSEYMKFSQIIICPHVGYAIQASKQQPKTTTLVGNGAPCFFNQIKP